MNETVLEGCMPTPLASYLKALGVLRLLSAKYPETRGFWRYDRFVLHTPLDREGIERFFLEDYAPTPIMAPWNGGSGFYEKDNKDALCALQQSSDPRLAALQASLRIADSILQGMDRSASPKNEAKAALLASLRGQLPDDALPWLDASVLLSGNDAQYPPLLGTGGNDGRLDFTNNFMQRLLDVLGPEQHEPSQRWLATSLFAKAAAHNIKSAIGQFSPGQAGGPNSTTGFDADASINPWDFVLMIEGTLLFAAAAARRNADDPAGLLSYPFTVRAVGAGSGSLGEGDTTNARGELWMPLWKRAASFAEVRTLLAEGRTSLGTRPVRDALDFVRAAHRFGSYRGIDQLQRFGLLMRSGKAFLATPLSRIAVSMTPNANWLDELDRQQWLDRFRRYARGDKAANRFRILRKRLEDHMFALAGREPSKAEAQALLVLLGEIQAGLSASSKVREEVAPLPRLSERWVAAADDGSAAFRIAKALAGLKGSVEQPMPLRAHLFPVERKLSRWMSAKSGEKYRFVTGCRGRLIDTLHNLFELRLWLAEKLELHAKPLESPAGATLADIAAFLRDDGMDARISYLLAGLALCDIPSDIDRSAGHDEVPAAFALMKLALTSERALRSLDVLANGQRLPVPTGMLAQLAAGNHDNRAVTSAWRRLRASGLSPLFTPDALPTLAGIDPKRAAAALLIPLRFGATAAIARSVLKQPEAESV